MSDEPRPLAIHRAAPGVLADGQETQIRADPTGALVVAGGGGGGAFAVQFAPPTTYESLDAGGTLEDSGVIRGSPGTLVGVDGYNASASTRYFQLFDAVAVPVDGTTPDTIPIEVPPGTHFTFNPNNAQGKTFSIGIAWASSTTQLTKTLTGAADMIVTAGHRAP